MIVAWFSSILIAKLAARFRHNKCRLSISFGTSANEIDPMTHYIAVAAIVVAGVCTTAMNWRFSFQLGTSVWDSYTWAIFSVALDVAKWFMLPYAARAWKVNQLRSAAALSIWLVATIYSFTAAIGFAALNRDAVNAERQHQTNLRKEVETIKLSPRWQASAACADATIVASKEFCSRYAAVAGQLKLLSQAADPQSADLAHMLGLQPETVSFVLSILLATACEVISALGFYAIMSPTKEASTKTPAPRWQPPRWTPSVSAKEDGAPRHGAAGPSATRPATPRRSKT
jgi:hypothetical protein